MCKTFIKKWAQVLSDLALNHQCGIYRKQKRSIIRHYSMFIFQTLIIGHLLIVNGLQQQLIATLDWATIQKPATTSMTGVIINTKSWPNKLTADGCGRTTYLDLVLSTKMALLITKTLWTKMQLHLMNHTTWLNSTSCSEVLDCQLKFTFNSVLCWTRY